MDIQSRITRLPIAYEPELGAEAAGYVPGASGQLAALLAGAGGCSPFLAGLIRKEAAWLETALEAPESAAAAELASMAQLPPDQIADGLRQTKRRFAVLLALADLGGVWPLETITKYLTELADGAVDAALKSLLIRAQARGKLPGLSADGAAAGGGIAILAMGKMGAFELNYSSDIDLICLFDETQIDPDDYAIRRSGYIRIIREMTALLSGHTGQGYVFRTDLRLRPDPSVTPVCIPMASAEAYYASAGRTWERAAFIKARAAAGDIAAGAQFLKTLKPFVWRKHLDFAAIEDAHSIRLKIRDHKGLHGPLSLPGHDVKLGRGGIREIEFYTQTRQLIAGGRDRSLRARGTTTALAALAKACWLPDENAQLLTAHYRAHREVEHRLQMVHDTQTQSLPQSPEGFARLAAMMGLKPAALTAQLEDRFDAVHELTEGFFDQNAENAAADDPSGGNRAAPGFGEKTTARWPSYPALRSDRAVEIFERLRPEILAQLSQAARPEEALAAFDGFLAGLPAGVQLFSLFQANPQLTQLIVDIAATAPELARYLAHNASVFDAVIGGGFFDPWPGAVALDAMLAGELAEQAAYEAQLDTARRWMKEWHFRIGVHHLRGVVSSAEAGGQYSDIAQACIRGLWPVVLREFEQKHGPAPGQGAMVLAMGSLGAGRLNAKSDLDLIVIYDAQGQTASEGRRPLAARAYFARLTQAMITALTAPTAEGRLYEVDMRLRPSGRQGPVAVSLASFESYQMEEAWTWEHLALTRARPIAGAKPLMEQVEAARARVLAAKSASPSKVAQDVEEMRGRLAGAQPGAQPSEPSNERDDVAAAPRHVGAQNWDAKSGPGRLQDVELIAQMGALLASSSARSTSAQLEASVKAGWFAPSEADDLRDAAALFGRLQAASKLLTSGKLQPGQIGEGGRQFILRETAIAARETLDIAALSAQLDAVAGRARSAIAAIITRLRDSEQIAE